MNELRPVLRRGMTPFRWLLVGVALFFVVSFALSWMRALEFQTTTWDMGLYQQALWSTAHGRAFYETADVETGGYTSLLQVHSVFLFYLIAPLYGALPSQVTLFAVQSAVVAVAAVPLYLLARDLTQSPWLALLAGAFYLGWTPVLSSVLYDFHPEAFLPVELFTLALLWHRGRYSWGFLAAAFAFTTLELAPVLTFFFALFGLGEGVRESRLSTPGAGSHGRLDRAVSLMRHLLARPKVRASLALLLASAVAYEALFYLRVDYLIATLGTYPVPQPPVGYVIGTTPSALGLDGSNLWVGFSVKTTYWLVALALLAFVPLLAPRVLLLALPWFAFTMFSTDLNYVTLGFQYGFIAASSLLVGFAYGLPEARRLLEPWPSRSRSTPPTPSSPPPVPEMRRRRIALVIGIAALLAVNLALTPLDPTMQNNGLGAAYRISYAPAPGYAQVEQLVGLVPPSATVVASDNLFPLVANDENAYSFSWMYDPTLAWPFTPSHPPTFVLVSDDATGAVTPWLASLLYDRAVFGVRGVAWSSGAGTVLLFESGYAGAVATFGPTPGASGAFYGWSIVASQAGLVASVPGSTYPLAVESAPGGEGTVWEGPYASLPPGNYSVELSLRASPLDGYPDPNASEPVVWIGASAFAGAPYYGWSWPWGALNSSRWTTVKFNISVAEPMVEFEVQGVLLDGSVEVTLNYLRVSADPGAGANVA